MKFKGKKPQKGNTVHVVIPRQGDESLLFTAQGIFDYTPFTKQYPEPQPPKIVQKGITKIDYDNVRYKAKFLVWATMKANWMVIESLKATPELEWESVVAEDPATWANYNKELGEVLLPAEVDKVVGAVMDACGLSSQKIEDATQSFLLGRGPVLLNSSSQDSEVTDTLSLELAKD